MDVVVPISTSPPLKYESPFDVIKTSVLLSPSIKDNSPFFKSFFKQLARKQVRFDVSLLSTWNFVHTAEFHHVINNHFKLGDKQTLISQTSIKINEILRHFGVNVTSWDIKVGDCITHFPNQNIMNPWFAQNDTGANLTWLTDLKAIYDEK